MNKLVIQHHDFENAKNEIKKFSEQTITDLDFKKVNDSKSVGEFLGDWLWGRGIGLDHKVTGEELNDLTSQIEIHLHSINDTQIKLIKQFGQVYSALEALHKDYIQAILTSIKSTEEASESIRKHQEDIDRILTNQRKTLIELNKFKQKLGEYAHLDDIDKIWDDCQKWHQDISSLTKELSEVTQHGKDVDKKIEALKSALSVSEKKTGELSAQFSQTTERLESVTAFTSALEKIAHLQDVDEIWESLVTAHSALKNIGITIEVIQKGVSKHQEEINKILAFAEQTSSLQHLMDVDELWSLVEEQQLRLKGIDCINDGNTGQLEFLLRENSEIADRVSANENSIKNLNESINKINGMAHLKKEYSGQLAGIEKHNEDIAASIQKNKEDIDVKIAETNNSISSLTQKIKYAYWIAGGSAGLAMIELVLLLMQVI